MALNNTGNPVPSTSGLDIADNAQVLDELLNGSANEVTGRTGKSLKSIAYIQNIISSLDVGDFTFASITSGLAGTTTGQYFRVPQGAGASVAFIYYLNNSGAADEVAETVGNVYADSSYASTGEYAKSGYYSAEMSSDFFLIYGVNADGKLVIGGIASVMVNGESLDLSSLSQSVSADDSEYQKSAFKQFEASSDLFLLSGIRLPLVDKVFYIKQFNSVNCLFYFDSNLGKEVQVTWEQYPVSNVIDKGDEVWFTWENTEYNAKQNLFFVRKDNPVPYPLIPDTDNIVFFGHSFIDNPRMAAKMQNLTGKKCIPLGRAGAISRCIAYRFGAYKFYYMPTNGTMPEGSDDFYLSPTISSIFGVTGSALGSSAYEQIQMKMQGETLLCKWSPTNAGGILRASRTDATAAARDIPDLTECQWQPWVRTSVTDINDSDTVLTEEQTIFPSFHACVNIIWMGRNTLPDVDTAIQDLKNVVKIAEESSHSPRIVIMPEFPNSNETKGTANYKSLVSYNSQVKSLFPDYYCEVDGVDALDNFKSHYNPAYSQDVTDISNDITPTSLRYDFLHPSQTLNENALYVGADVNAEFILKFMKIKGWL